MAALEDEFKYIMSNMSCHNVLKVSYKYRCTMAKSLMDCERMINFFNYFKLMFCYLRIHDRTTEIFAILLLLIGAIAFVLLMSIMVDNFFMPILEILSVKLHMNEYLAGVTLVAFVNSSPELIGNLMPINEDAALFTCTIGNALAILLLCGGMVCYLKPFTMDGHCTARNLLFLLLAVVLVRFIMFRDGNVSQTDAIVLLSVYVAFLIINIADLILVRHTIRKLRVEIAYLRLHSQLDASGYDLKKKEVLLFRLERNGIMNFKKRSSNFNTQKDTGQPVSRPSLEQFEANRTILHSPRNPKNRFLCRDLLESLNPIDVVDWRISGCCGRVLIILKTPLLLIVTVIVPVVDYRKCKHGWSKLLNCTQIVTNPFILITLVHSKFADVYSTWYIDFNLSYSKWSPCFTVPLALLVFFHARTDLPPTYHILFVAMSASSSVVFIVLCVGEVEILTSIVGIAFNLSESFVDITFGSLTNATIDLMSNFALTRQGYEKMAFAATSAGPFCSIVVGMGIAFLFNEQVRMTGSVYWLNGEHGDNCYLFMLIAIITQLWWCLTFNFCARRSAGIFSWVIFALFMLYEVAAEWHVVLSFTRDKTIQPQ